MTSVIVRIWGTTSLSKEKPSKQLFGLSPKDRDKLVADVLKKRQRRAENGGDGDGAEGKAGVRRFQREVPEKFYRFSKFPGYHQLHVQREVAERAGISNPFFMTHEGIAGATTRIGNREYINYSNYNYLALNGHPRINDAALAAIESYGTSTSASRIVSGERPIHRQLERAIMDLIGAEECLIFVSGHATNVSTIGQLFGPRDLILHDALSHNSIAQGALLSGAKRISFPHNDWRRVDQILEERRHDFEKVVIITEGIYSMDGDYPPMDRFVELRAKHKILLMIDEAHSMGVLGERGMGIREHFNLAATDIDIWMGTLSKSFCGCGGYIAGERALIEFLKFTAGGFVYSVAMPPPVAAAALAAIELMREEPERVARLHDCGRLFVDLAKKKGLDTGYAEGYAVVPIIVGGSVKAGQMANAMFERGINVQPIIYPAVEERAARLRFFLCADHTDEQIASTIDTVAEELEKLDRAQRDEAAE